MRGLTLGGDDYLVKPFSLEELVARIQRGAAARRARPATDAVLRCADLELDDDAHRVDRGRRRGRRCRRPSTTCCASCSSNQGRVLSKAQILDHVWQYDFGGDGGVVETYIGYLRRKVDAVEPAAHPHDPRRRLHAARTAGLRCRCGPGCSSGMAVVAVVLVVAAFVVTRTTEHLPRRPGRRPARAGRHERPALPTAARPVRPGRRPDVPELAVRRRASTATGLDTRRTRRTSTRDGPAGAEGLGPARRERRGATVARSRVDSTSSALDYRAHRERRIAPPANVVVVGLPLDDVDAAVRPPRRRRGRRHARRSSPSSAW